MDKQISPNDFYVHIVPMFFLHFNYILVFWITFPLCISFHTEVKWELNLHEFFALLGIVAVFGFLEDEI